MPLDLRALLDERLRNVGEMWAQDLSAHRPEELTRTPVETARSVADFAYETIYINRRIAMRLRGETPPPLTGFPPQTGPCPEELSAPGPLAEAMRASVVEIADAIGEPERVLETQSGPTTSFALAEFAVLHMYYHLGQVNYAQTLYGDAEVHWK